MVYLMTKMQELKFWDELCESFEAACGVSNAKHILEVPFDLNEWDGLGNHYEKMTAKKYKAEYGQFFTPKNIVEYLIDSAQYKNTHVVADISCGSGRFLLGVIERLIKAKNELHEIQERIFGFDIDPILVRITLANVRGLLAKQGYGGSPQVLGRLTAEGEIAEAPLRI